MHNGGCCHLQVVETGCTHHPQWNCPQGMRPAGMRRLHGYCRRRPYVNVGVETLPYASCTEDVAWILFFPQTFSMGGWKGEGGEKVHGSKWAPASSGRLLKDLLTLKAKVFVQELQQDKTVWKCCNGFSVLVTFLVLYTVRRPDSWGCCILCHFTSCMLMSTSKAACFILKLNDFTDIS